MAINRTSCLQTLELGLYRTLTITNLEVANLRSLNLVRPGSTRTIEALVKYINRGALEFLPMEEAPGSSPALVRALEQNTSITSLCAGGEYALFGQAKDWEIRFKCHHHRSSDDGRDPWHCASTWPLDMPTADSESFESHFEYWFCAARIAAIAERNSRLARRVRRGAFSFLRFARIVCRATNRESIRLPTEVLLHIASCASGGVLSYRQEKRLLDHAADPDSSKRLAQILGDAARAGGAEQRERLRDEWLHNGGIRWELGLDAAKVELGAKAGSPDQRTNRGVATRARKLAATGVWPQPGDIEGILKFLAFAPSPDACWHGDRPEVVRSVVERYS